MCYFFCNWSNKTCNNEYKALYSCSKLLTQDSIKLLEQLESCFTTIIILQQQYFTIINNNNNFTTTIIISWNKYQSKVVEQVQNIYLDYLIDPSF